MSSKLVKIALATGALILLLALVGVISFYVWLNRWLAGEDCRQLVSGLVSSELGIQGNFQPFHWSGFSVYSEGFQGQGVAGGSVRNVRAEQVRAELNFPALLRGTWEISEISVARIQADLGEPAAADIATPPNPGGGTSAPKQIALPFLPKDFVLRKLKIKEANLTWPGETSVQGFLAGTQIDVTSDGPDWKFAGTGGKFFQPGLPELKVENYQARFKPPQHLYVDYVLHDSTEGTMSGRGQIDFGTGGKLELQLDLKKVDIAPFLTEDWRAKLSGKVNGPVELETGLGKKDDMKAKGTLKLTEAKVEALPILNTVALFTRTQDFRSMKLQTAQADFHWEKEKIQLDNIVLESELLLKITGNYLQANGRVDGLLQVGTTVEALRYIPGAKDKVFTDSRDGYVWTPVRLSGTPDHIQEDLTPRLQNAAVGAVMDVVPGEVKEKVNEGVNSVLDLLKQQVPLP